MLRETQNYSIKYISTEVQGDIRDFSQNINISMYGIKSNNLNLLDIF